MIKEEEEKGRQGERLLHIFSFLMQIFITQLPIQPLEIFIFLYGSFQWTTQDWIPQTRHSFAVNVMVNAEQDKAKSRFPLSSYRNAFCFQNSNRQCGDRSFIISKTVYFCKYCNQTLWNLQKVLSYPDTVNYSLSGLESISSSIKSV